MQKHLGEYIYVILFFLYLLWTWFYSEQKCKRYTTIFYILWESIGQKYLPMLNNVSQISSKRFVEIPPIMSPFDVWVVFLFVF